MTYVYFFWVMYDQPEELVIVVHVSHRPDLGPEWLRNWNPVITAPYSSPRLRTPERHFIGVINLATQSNSRLLEITYPTRGNALYS